MFLSKQWGENEEMRRLLGKLGGRAEHFKSPGNPKRAE